MFVVFNIFDPSFYSGKVSEKFNALAENGDKPWFFQPSDWAPHPGSAWYGSQANSMVKVLMPYSMGHATAAEAEAAAHQWARDRFDADGEVVVRGA